MNEAVRDWSPPPCLRELAETAVKGEGVWNDDAFNAALDEIQELVRDLAATVKSNPPPTNPDRLLAAQLVERAERMLSHGVLCY